MTTDPPAAPRNAATALARTVVDELVRNGMRHVVLSPGSRSAALAYAVHDEAVAGRVTLHTRIDERTGAFLALGLARTSRTPVAVVTTSGTAVANLHPAVLEASHSGLPLVLLTADRPARLRGTGANQTTEQTTIFGGAVRVVADVSAAVPGRREAEDVRGWRSLVARTVLTATGRAGVPRGPVQLNLQFDGPLTPDSEDGWSTSVTGRPGGEPWTTVAPVARPAATGPLEPGPRTVVVAGDDAGPPARLLAEAAGWPLLAEPTSGSRTGTHAIRTYRLLLDDPDLAGAVERVVVCGHPTLSRPVSELLGRPDVEVVAAVADSAAVRSWTDPGHAVAHVVALPLDTAELAAAASASEPWLARWRARDAEVGARLDTLLADSGEELTGLHVAGAVARALPAGGLLHVGASNPVRDLDLMVPRYGVGERRLVVANRGLAGIDGTVSSAVGAALGRSGSTRAFALLGDVTFLHDLTGLVVGPGEPCPDLTIVVVNDDGGSIFALLEQGAPAYADSFERIFGTPHGVDLAAACAATGTPHVRVGDLPSLESELARPASGLRVLETVVRRDSRRELDATVRALVR